MTKVLTLILLSTLTNLFAQNSQRDSYERFLEYQLGIDDPNVMAPFSCDYGEGEIYKYTFKESIIPRSRGCKKIKFIQDQMTKVDDVIAPYMKNNTELNDINILLIKEYDNAFYAEGLGNLILLPEIFFLPTKEKKHIKHPKFLGPIIMHEYAHYLMRKNFPKADKYFSKKHRNNGSSKLLLSAYHELTADIISFLITKDPKSISDGLHFTGFANESIFNKLISRLRDFENHKNKLRTIDNRLRNLQKNSQEYATYFMEHTLLAPVRHEIFRKYSKYLNSKNKGKLIKDLLSNLAETLNNEISVRFLADFNYTPKDYYIINSTFIKNLL